MSDLHDKLKTLTFSDGKILVKVNSLKRYYELGDVDVDAIVDAVIQETRKVDTVEEVIALLNGAKAGDA